MRVLLRKFGEPLLALGALVVVVTCTQLKAQRLEVPVPSSSVVASGAPTAPAVAPPRHATGAAPEPATTGVAVAADRAMLGKWQLSLTQLEQGQRVGPVRILWFGDSHTAADYFPNALRKQLAARVAPGGPGYVSLGVSAYRHGLAKVWSEGSLEIAPHPPARRSREDDGVFGLGGTRATFRDNSAYVSVRPIGFPAPVAMSVELTYRLPTESDVLRVTVGQQRFDLTAASPASLLAGIRQQHFDMLSDATFEVRSLRGKPQVFGAIFETQTPGLVIDTLGVNGARFGTFLAWEPEPLASLVAQRQPALFIVAYGTNEVFDPEPVDKHAQRLAEVVERLRRAAPDASCLVIGPTDAGRGGEATRTRVVALDAAERATAARVSCAYFSPLELMLGEGGFETWLRQEPPLALSDGIHLSVRGYARLGDALYELLR